MLFVAAHLSELGIVFSEGLVAIALRLLDGRVLFQPGGHLLEHGQQAVDDVRL